MRTRGVSVFFLVFCLLLSGGASAYSFTGCPMASVPLLQNVKICHEAGSCCGCGMKSACVDDSFETLAAPAKTFAFQAPMGGPKLSTFFPHLSLNLSVSHFREESPFFARRLFKLYSEYRT